MPRIKLTLQGNKGVLKGLKRINDNIIKGVEREIEASSYEIHSKAVNRVPVDTGFLKNSLNVQKQGLTAQVEASVKYAPYVEFGTGGLVDVPKGLEDYAIRFKGKGVKQVNLPARPFLFNSFFEERPKLVSNIEKVLKDELR